MKTVAILIDFDNMFQRQMNCYTNADFHRTIDFAINTAKTAIPDVERFVIRLYGGWYENNSLTARASAVSALLPDLNNKFPIVEQPGRIIRGNVELATQLYGHSFVWYNSYREHYGLHSLRVNTSAMSEKCAEKNDTCPVKILKKFTEKKSKRCHHDGCKTIHSNVFFQRAQKYVDTIIACDIIILGGEEEVAGIYVMSEDVDLFPAFAVAHDLNGTEAKLGLILRNDSQLANYNVLLTPFEIQVTYVH